MKDAPALQRVVGTSHARIARVALYDDAGRLVTDQLPIVDATVSASAVDVDRWTIDGLRLAGVQWAPVLPSDPLSGLARHYVVAFMGATVDTADEWVEVCRAVPTGSRLVESADGSDLDVACIGYAGYLARGLATRYSALRDETCQGMIRRVVQEARLPGWSGVIVDDTTPVPIPLGYYTDDATPYDVLRDLEAIANVTTHFDAVGRLIIRDPLPNVWRAAVRDIAAGSDQTLVDVATGTDDGFANRVEVTFVPVGAGRQRVSSAWQYRQQTGKPAVGELRTTNNGDGTQQWKIHNRDADGRLRKTGLRKIDSGDLLEALAPSGGRIIAEVQSSSEEDGYQSVTVEYVTEDGDTAVSNNDVIELVGYVGQRDDVVGVAEWEAGPLAPASAGLVTYTETRAGKVTQTQANARAAAVLEVTARAWQTVMVEAVPDVRLEPDDDVTVTRSDGRVLYGRVTAVQLPAAPDRPMTVGVRVFPDERVDVFDGLLPGPQLYPSITLTPRE